MDGNGLAQPCHATIAGLVRHLTANKASRWLVPWLVYFSPGGAQTPKGCVIIPVPVHKHHSSSLTMNGGKNCGRAKMKTDPKTSAPRDSTSKPCWLARNWLIRFGRLGMRGLLSELSIPWNREQTDSLTQGIIEAGPRYQSKKLVPRREPCFPNSTRTRPPEGGVYQSSSTCRFQARAA